MPTPRQPRKASPDPLINYAGRWIALLDGKVIGQGGTPDQARLAAKFTRPKDTPQVVFVSLPNSIDLSPLIDKIASMLPPDREAYIVGGVVRDMLLGRQSHDLDLVMKGDVMEITRSLANRLGAAYFPMDPEHGVARLILRQQDGDKIVVDVATMRGPDLETDLRSRDFTINAMALEIHDPQAVLDPLGGAVDLQEKRLAPCLPSSFSDDPVRVLRGLRLAAAYGLKIPQESRQKMRQAAPMLPMVSPERLRDELFRILDGPQPAAVLRGMEMLGALAYVLPELAHLKGVEQSPPHLDDVWNHTLSVLVRLECILDLLGLKINEEKASSLHAGMVVMQLGRYRQQIAQHLAERLNPERTLRALLFLAALYHDAAKPETRSVESSGRVRFFNHEEIGAKLAINRGQALRLSNDEIERMAVIVANHMRPMLLALSEDQPTPRAIYRFFRVTDKAGLDVCLLSLADTWATYGETLSQTIWNGHLDVVRALMGAWWERPEQHVSPPALLNGTEIMHHFHLVPGPLIGELLESIREAQAIGLVSTKEDALGLIGKQLAERKKPPDKLQYE